MHPKNVKVREITQEGGGGGGCSPNHQTGPLANINPYNMGRWEGSGPAVSIDTELIGEGLHVRTLLNCRMS